MDAKDLTRVRRRLRKARTEALAKWSDARGRERQYLAGVVEGIDYAGRVLDRRGYAAKRGRS